MNDNDIQYELSTDVYATPKQQSERLIPLGRGYYRDKISNNILYNYDEMPSATVTGHKKKKSINDNWQAAYAKGIPSGTMSADMDVANAVTGGAFNLIQPSQFVGATVRFINDKDFGQFGRNLILGNNGIVTDNFANEHPYISAIANSAFDLASLGSYNVYKNRLIPKSRFNLKKPNHSKSNYTLPNDVKAELNNSQSELIQIFADSSNQSNTN